MTGDIIRSQGLTVPSSCQGQQHELLLAAMATRRCGRHRTHTGYRGMPHLHCFCILQLVGWQA
ncbi:hypothetical protein PAMP_015815 [Pampus punctatissimus]